jgi:hypothetical protein
VKEAIPLQLEPRTTRHAVGPGELFFGLGQFQRYRPEEIGAQLGHDLSVALGKLSVYHASVSCRLRRRAASRSDEVSHQMQLIVLLPETLRI